MMFRSPGAIISLPRSSIRRQYRHDRILTRQRIVCLVTLADALSPLPLTLLNFSASPKSQTVVVGWQTASESQYRLFRDLAKPGPLSFAALGGLMQRATVPAY